METETAELRSKDEIKADIERNRTEVTSAVRRTKTAAVERNPAVLAWRATKRKYFATKAKSVSKARQTDVTIRSNIYRSIGFVLLAGMVVGLFARRKRKIVVCKEI